MVSNSASKTPAIAQPVSIQPTPHTFKIRSLKTLEDLKVVQARLLREYLAGKMDAPTAKTAAHLTNVLGTTMKALQPPEGVGEMITEVHITAYDEAEEELIRQMNTNILPPPEDNQ